MKIECKNHAIENYGKAFYNMKKEKHFEILTTQKIKDFQTAAQNALYRNENGSINELNKQLENEPQHVLGNHKHCGQWCTEAGNIDGGRWNEVETSGLHYQIESALKKLHRKAYHLIANQTTNKAESFMALSANIMGENAKTFAAAICFHGRAILASLQANIPIEWIGILWQKLTEQEPGQVFQKYLEAAKKDIENTRKRKSTPAVRKRVKKGEHWNPQNQQDMALQH